MYGVTLTHAGAAAAALISSPAANPLHLTTAALFHSTSVLERIFYKYRNFTKRIKNLNVKQILLQNVSAYREHLLESTNHDKDDPDSSKGCSWYWDKKFRRGRTRTWGRRDFQICVDDDEVDRVFRSAFTGFRFVWSSGNEERGERSSSNYSNNHNQEKQDSLSATLDRLVLGLSASGPLNPEDVKTAQILMKFPCCKRFKSCSLKWHPDRHSGSSKVAAGERFKPCSAAYQSLCDKLALN